MRGLRVLLVLFLGCGGAVAVTESGGDGGTTSPGASLDAGGAVFDAAVPETSSIADASVDVVTDGGPVDAGVDAIADAASDGEAGDADADAVPPAETVVDVATSLARTCFVMSTGRLLCAGSGFGTTPTLVAGVTDAVEVAIGGREGLGAHTCIRRKGGTVDCWGYNSLGQLGDGTANNARATPAPVTGLNDVVQLALPDGDHFTCARKSDGTVWCWGGNNYAQLGLGGGGGYGKVPYQVRGLTDAVDLAVGFGGGCAIRNGGQVVCWGFSEGGLLGDGFLTHDNCPYLALPNRCSFYPVPASVSDAVAIARGGTSAYVIRADGTVWGWGWGSAGVGTGSSASKSVPTATLGPVVATKISAGGHGACAVRPNGTVTCWGIDSSGQLGNGLPATDSTSPVDVLGIADATSITHRAASVCALRGGSKVSCWGYNGQGNLGNGATANVTPSPVDVVW